MKGRRGESFDNLRYTPCVYDNDYVANVGFLARLLSTRFFFVPGTQAPPQHGWAAVVDIKVVYLGSVLAGHRIPCMFV